MPQSRVPTRTSFVEYQVKNTSLGRLSARVSGPYPIPLSILPLFSLLSSLPLSLASIKPVSSFYLFPRSSLCHASVSRNSTNSKMHGNFILTRGNTDIHEYNVWRKVYVTKFHRQHFLFATIEVPNQFFFCRILVKEHLSMKPFCKNIFIEESFSRLYGVVATQY